MRNEPVTPSTFIIRIWKEPVLDAQEHQWRFVLINSTSLQRKGFARVKDLLKMLEEELLVVTEEPE